MIPAFLRSILRSGRGRTVGSWIVGIGSAVAFGLLWDWIIKNTPSARPSDAVQKAAFVPAAFAVTAYNLRTRVVDLLLKLQGTPAFHPSLADKAKKCGTRLTSLVLLFVCTAILMGIGGIVSDVGGWGKGIAVASIGLFFASVAQFIYILFAFEILEEFILDEASRSSKKAAVDRLTNPDK